MGYTFLIGNATVRSGEDDDCLWAYWEVAGETHPEAPVFPNDTMTGNSNMRCPSYFVWDDFCTQTNLHDVFYNEQGILHCGHPGCMMITQELLDTVKAALDSYRLKATKPPGFQRDKDLLLNPATGTWYTPPELEIYDPMFARLIWLEWWMRWAFNNCPTPAISNS